MGLTMAVAYTVGRFQPPTLGHVEMIDEMLTSGKKCFVFISSAVDSLLPSATKKSLLTKMLTRKGDFPSNLTLVDTKADCGGVACGGPYAGWKYLRDKRGFTDITLVIGQDRAKDFDPNTAPMWSEIKVNDRPKMMITIREKPAGAVSYSSTKARAALAASGATGLKPFMKVPDSALTDADIAAAAQELLAKQGKWPKPKGGGEPGEDLSAFDEDDESVTGGRRKTRRRRRSNTKRILKKRYQVR